MHDQNAECENVKLEDAHLQIRLKSNLLLLSIAENAEKWMNPVWIHRCNPESGVVKPLPLRFNRDKTSGSL